MVAAFDLADFEKVFAVNVRSAFLGSAAAVRQMMAQPDRGKIVFTASIAGLKGDPGVSVYVASKHAVMGLTKVAAGEVGPLGIRVNGLAPGLVDTKLTRVTTQNPQRREGALSRIPAGRLGEPADMAGAALFLASPLAAYVCGHTLVVDGGLSL